MRPLYWKLGIVTTVGLALGAFTGQATIAGMAPATTLATNDPLGNDPVATSPEHVGSQAVSAGQSRIVQACPECSDYDLGYRFAASRHLSQTDECMDYSWSYQRGCLAYLRDG